MPPNRSQIYQQGRYWILTIPAGSWSPPTELSGRDDVVWLRGQREQGTETGFEHWQLFVAFGKKKRLAGVKAVFTNDTHAELSRSEAAESYVFKENTAIAGSRFELGAKKFNRSLPSDWEKIRNLAKEGKLDEVDPEIFIKHYNTLKTIRKDYMAKPDDLEEVCGVWIWGEPGVGKSKKAREDYPNSYFKMCNKWWDGYQNQETVIIDDLDLNHNVLGHHLKIWADRYSFIGEAKGGALHIRPKKIIVTSNYPIETIFPETALCEAIKRRFEIINLI